MESISKSGGTTTAETVLCYTEGSDASAGMKTMYQVCVEEAITRLPQLIAEANGGKEVILTQDSQPVAKLIAVTPATRDRPRRPSGTAKGLILHIADDFDAPLDDFKEYIAL